MTSVTALVRRPGPNLADGLVTHIERQLVDVDLALQQWENYVATLRGVGWHIVEVAPLDDCPDAVFIEDTVVVRGNTALITHPGASSRRPEVAAVRDVVRDLGYDLAEVATPATLDGGDVLKIGDRIYVGQGGRSNAAGAAALATAFGGQGVDVVPVEVTKVLHLKSGVTALPDGTVVGYLPLVDDASAFPSFLAVPEEAGAHVVVVDERRIIMASDAPRSAALFEDLGYDPIVVSISEFQKLEGCVTCLSVRLRELP